VTAATGLPAQFSPSSISFHLHCHLAAALEFGLATSIFVLAIQFLDLELSTTIRLGISAALQLLLEE